MGQSIRMDVFSLRFETVAGPRSPCETDDEVSRLKTTRAVRNDEAPPRGNFAFVSERETRRIIGPVRKFFEAFPLFFAPQPIAHVTFIRSPRSTVDRGYYRTH